MATLLTLLNFRRVLIIVGAITVILILLIDHEPAAATVSKPNQDRSLATYNDRPKGMWSDGTTLYVVENDSRWGGQYLVLSYDFNNWSLNQGEDTVLDSSNTDPQGIWSDGTVMWIGDGDETKLFAYALSDSSRLADRDINLAWSNDDPRGMWGFNETILVIDKDDTYVHAYSTADGSRLEDEGFDLHSDNGNPWGIWAQGTRVWISDIDDQMLYVYERNPNSSSHGDRVPTLEVRLPGDVDDVRSIWSDGETMWALNKETHPKLYAMYFRDFRHSGDELDITQVNSPAGLWTDGETMWVADTGRSDQRRLLAFDLSDGSRKWGKDVYLHSTHVDPSSMWSDGTTVWVIFEGTSTNYLYAYYMDPTPNQVGEVILHEIIQLHSNNADPVGTWSDGDTIWVSDSDDDKLYAYDLSAKSRKSGEDISLHSQNVDSAGIWSDGKTIWVFDTNDKHAYAYNLSDGSRKKGKEFWTVPDNDDPDGGLTGHGLRFWVIDGDDEKLYAYGKVNTPPEFSETSASFKIHWTASAGEFVGSVPGVVDPDGDTISYLLTSGGLGVFRLDNQSGEIFIRDDAAGFSGGEEYTLTVAITDNKGGLDGLDSSADDAINVTIDVTPNADPVFTTPDEAVFTAAEDAAEFSTIAELGISDPDNDSLTYSYQFTPELTANYPISYLGGVFTVKSGKKLDYERTSSYQIHVKISDGKDEWGETDPGWDDEIDFTIQVTNVDEDGRIVLGSAHPQVGTEFFATLRDPDGVDLSNGNQVNWIVATSSDGNTWTEVSNRDTSSASRGYTPQISDTDKYLLFRATYKDRYDTVNAKSVEAETDNKTLAEAPSNGPPSFTESTPITRSIAEDAAGDSHVGAPVAATDPDGDTIEYLYVESHTDKFSIDSTNGQITLQEDESLDYEAGSTYHVLVIVRDNKDLFGNWDDFNDAMSLVTINVTNVEEAGILELSSDSPYVDMEMTAQLSDPDGSITNLTWQWQTADSAEATTWTNVSGATLGSYTPEVGDKGKYLRAKAAYDDGEGTGKEAFGVATDAVVQLDNEPPTFDEGASTTRSLEENSAAGTIVGAIVSATDPDGDSLTYTLALGLDSALFKIDGATGRLRVAPGAVLDYENDASLEVELQVSDGKVSDHSQDTAIDDTIAVAIQLVNVDESGEVALSMMQPVVGKSITATLADHDGGVTGSSWQWEKSSDGATNWEAISSSQSDSYMPAKEDEDMYLRAMVDYTDGEGSGKTAEGMTGATVKSSTLDTSLASLLLSGIPFTFSSGTLDYSLTAPHSRKLTEVMPTATATSGVSVEITPADRKPNRGGHQVKLAVGETRITVTVSEDDGVGSTTYTLLVTREPAPQEDPQEDPPHENPPQQDPPQEDPPSEENVADKCRNDERDGVIAVCNVTGFAVVRVEHDGGITIDWSEWDSTHPEVTGYSIHLNQLLYKMYYDEDGRVSDAALADVYESCEFSDGEWSCEGTLESNYYEDWDGNPTQVQELASNEDLTAWTSALDNPGWHMFDKDFVRWTGDATDPDNEPVDISYQVKVFEMDFYYFSIYEGSQNTGMETVVVNGGNGFN